MLIRKGLFTRLTTEGFDVDGHSLDYVRLWRRALDENLLAMIGADKEEAIKAYEWFNSKPGDIGYYLDDITGEEVRVDNYEEFCLCCDLARIDHTIVRSVANKVLTAIKQEEKKLAKHI